MKKRTILIIGVAAVFAIIYISLGDQGGPKHPTLNESARLPDEYLKNVAYYEQSERHENSANSLEKAVAAIREIESDVDNESFEKLEHAIARLQNLHQAILKSSLSTQEMRSTFEYVLNSLTHAELEVSEMYAETNHLDKANLALKYAQLHVKNAILFHNEFWGKDTEQLAIEKHVFREMDSLLENEAVSPVEYIFALDKMMKEVDEVIDKQGKEIKP
jgi:hypothetical protein